MVAAAVEAIATLGDPTPALVERLTALLSAPESSIQTASVAALIQFGDEAKEALPTLLELEAENQAPAVRPLLLRALAAIDVENDAVFQRMQNAIKVGASETRVAAIEALRDTDIDSEKKLPLFLVGLLSTDRATRQSACEAIGSLGERAKSVAMQVIPLLDDSEDRGVALDTLRALRSRDENVYLATLNNEDAGVRLYGAEVFEFISRRRDVGSDAIEKLRDLSRNDDYFPVRRTAGRAIQNMLKRDDDR